MSIQVFPTAPSPTVTHLMNLEDLLMEAFLYQSITKSYKSNHTHTHTHSLSLSLSLPFFFFASPLFLAMAVQCFSTQHTLFCWWLNFPFLPSGRPTTMREHTKRKEGKKEAGEKKRANYMYVWMYHCMYVCIYQAAVFLSLLQVFFLSYTFFCLYIAQQEGPISPFLLFHPSP